MSLAYYFFFASQQYIENVLCDTQRENINLHI